MEVFKLCLTAFLSFLCLFIVAKVVGHKQISQLNFFDYVMGISVGSIAAEMATEVEATWKPFVAMVVYGITSVILSVIMTKFQRTRKYINGAPSILMDNGKIYRKNLKKAKLDLSEFMVLCREQGYFDLGGIQTAVYEYNGKLSILPVSTARPVTPEDLSLRPEQDYIFAELIMDGRILEGNLKRMGFDRTWLAKQLEQQGFHTAQEVFLAVCDRNQTLTCYQIGD